MTRLEFIRHLYSGRTISMHHMGKQVYQGKVHTFDIDICLMAPSRRYKGHRRNSLIIAYLYDPMMRKTYKVYLTAKNLLTYIRLHYPRGVRSVVSQAA